MSVFYFDTSAIVKRYVVETGTDWIMTLTNPDGNNLSVIAEITLVQEGRNPNTIFAMS